MGEINNSNFGFTTDGATNVQQRITGCPTMLTFKMNDISYLFFLLYQWCRRNLSQCSFPVTYEKYGIY